MDDLKETRKKITMSLQSKGWDKINYKVKFPSSSGTVDIVASSKGLRKKRLIIVIGSNEFDAGIAGFLLKGISEKGKNQKIMFLQEGNPLNVKTEKGISIIADVNDLPSP
ncbi:MAG: hypothetical protein ACXAC7_04820 [Candidatus Hodarchaeales archaeon]|jgi:hypothetical protein